MTISALVGPTGMGPQGELMMQGSAPDGAPLPPSTLNFAGFPPVGPAPIAIDPMAGFLPVPGGAPGSLRQSVNDLQFNNVILQAQQDALLSDRLAQLPKQEKMEQEHTNGLNSFFRGVKRPIEQLLTPTGLLTLAGGTALFMAMPPAFLAGITPYLLAAGAGVTALGAAKGGAQYLSAKNEWERSEALENLGSSTTNGLLLLPGGTAALKGLNAATAARGTAANLNMTNTASLTKQPMAWLQASATDLKGATLNPDVYRHANRLIGESVRNGWSNRGEALGNLTKGFQGTLANLHNWTKGLMGQGPKPATA